jgi:hypothetical protein
VEVIDKKMSSTFDVRNTEHYAYCPNCGREILVNPNDHTEAGHAIRQGLFCPCRCLEKH